MVLINDEYRIMITAKSMPSLEDYTVIYIPDNLDLRDFYSARLVKIEPKAEQTIFLAMIELITSYTDFCAVLENHILTVVLFETILQIDLKKGTVIRCVHCENIGGLEQIHTVDHGYIIKGESDIFRYDSALNRIWHFSARDIFASPTNDVCFWMDNHVIHCRDWEGWHYMLNLDGKLIHEELEKSPPS